MATKRETSATGRTAGSCSLHRADCRRRRPSSSSYSSPREAATHDEMEVVETLPWFESGKPLRNYMLHETDFYDEVEQIWGRRWGAEGIGTLREVLVSRPTENETRPEYAQEWQYYYSSAAGNADLGRLQAQFDAYYRRSKTTACASTTSSRRCPRSARTGGSRTSSRLQAAASSSTAARSCTGTGSGHGSADAR